MTRVDTARRQAGKAQKAAGRAKRDARKGASKTADRLGPRLEGAKDTAVSYASDAAEWVQPRLDTARHRVQDDLVPKITAAVTAALEASEPTREEAKSRGTAAISALRGDLQPPTSRKRRWGKRLVVLGSLGGAVVGAVVAWTRFGRVEAPTTIEAETATLAGTTSPRDGSQPVKPPHDLAGTDQAEQGNSQRDR